MSGFSRSSIVIVKMHVVSLPEPSIAVYSISCGESLMSKYEPGARPPLCTTVSPQSSSATGSSQNTAAPHLPGSLFKVTSEGQFSNTGGMLSTTTYVTEHVSVLPALSVTVHITVVEPTGNTAPASVWSLGAIRKLCLRVAPSQLSPNVGFDCSSNDTL
ncbi:MAG: hypothetical protein PGMFKBFP_02408 [Anaerolineales bacterium]|nr:hypothetical protein [Anaerolineales bacterium]